MNVLTVSVPVYQWVTVSSEPKQRRLNTTLAITAWWWERESAIVPGRGGHCVSLWIRACVTCVKSFRVAYARKLSWRSSPSVVRNDPRSCRENLSRTLVLGSHQEEPRGFRRRLRRRKWRWSRNQRRKRVVVLLCGNAGSDAFQGPGGLRRIAGGNARERAEVFCPTRTRLWLDYPRLDTPGYPSCPLLPPPPPPLRPSSSSSSSSSSYYSTTTTISTAPHVPSLAPLSSSARHLDHRLFLFPPSLLLLLLLHTTSSWSAVVRTPASFSMHRKTGTEARRGDSEIPTGSGNHRWLRSPGFIPRFTPVLHIHRETPTDRVEFSKFCKSAEIHARWDI